MWEREKLKEQSVAISIHSSAGVGVCNTSYQNFRFSLSRPWSSVIWLDGPSTSTSQKLISLSQQGSSGVLALSVSLTSTGALYLSTHCLTSTSEVETLMADTCSHPSLGYITDLFQPCLPQADSKVTLFSLGIPLPGGLTVRRKNMVPKQELMAALLVLGVTREVERQLAVLLAWS